MLTLETFFFQQQYTTPQGIVTKAKENPTLKLKVSRTGNMNCKNVVYFWEKQQRCSGTIKTRKRQYYIIFLQWLNLCSAASQFS